MQHHIFIITCKTNVVVLGFEKSPYIINMTPTSSQVGRMVEAKLIAPTSTNQRRGKQEWNAWSCHAIYKGGNARCPPLMWPPWCDPSRLLCHADAGQRPHGHNSPSGSHLGNPAHADAGSRPHGHSSPSGSHLGNPAHADAASRPRGRWSASAWA